MRVWKTPEWDYVTAQEIRNIILVYDYIPYNRINLCKTIIRFSLLQNNFNNILLNWFIYGILFCDTQKSLVSFLFI